MKKCIVFLLASLIFVMPIMNVQATSIEHPMMEMVDERPEEIGLDPEEGIDNDVSETDVESESEPITEEAKAEAEEQITVSEQETEVSTSTFALRQVGQGAFTYYLDQANQVKYREHRDAKTRKVDYAEEYYPGTVYGRDNIANGKKSIYIQMMNNRDETVRYRALIDKNEQWYQIEEYKKSMAWSYGTWYERDIEARFYIFPDKTIKFALVYLNGHTTPTHRFEYQPGTKYGEGHGGKITRRDTDVNRLWHMVDGDFVYYLTRDNEVKYREHRNSVTKKVDYAEEYYPGTVYGRDNIANGKKSIYIQMTNNRDEIVRYRALIDKNEQWYQIEEYKKAMAWSYGTWYEREIEARFFIHGDRTIKYADVYSGGHTNPTHRFEYQPGTKYGEGHGGKITKRSPYEQPKPAGPKWVMPVNGVGYIYCIFEQCTDGAYGGRHNGTDIPVPIGTGVQSIADGGTVTMSTYSQSLGNVIGVHYKVDGIDFYVVYAHLSERWVNVGDVTTIGRTIGLSGNTGMSTGPHLHIEIQKDTWWFEGNPVARRNRSLPLSWIFGNHVGLGYRF